MSRQRSAPLHSKAMARDASGYCAGGLKATIVIATVVYAGWASSSALAQGSKDRMIEQDTYKDIMRESGLSRDVAIAFKHEVQHRCSAQAER
jgi:hypothetical protein